MILGWLIGAILVLLGTKISVYPALIYVLLWFIIYNYEPARNRVFSLIENLFSYLAKLAEKI